MRDSVSILQVVLFFNPFHVLRFIGGKKAIVPRRKDKNFIRRPLSSITCVALYLINRLIFHVMHLLSNLHVGVYDQA